MCNRNRLNILVVVNIIFDKIVHVYTCIRTSYNIKWLVECRYAVRLMDVGLVLSLVCAHRVVVLS